MVGITAWSLPTNFVVLFYFCRVPVVLLKCIHKSQNAAEGDIKMMKLTDLWLQKQLLSFLNRGVARGQRGASTSQSKALPPPNETTLCTGGLWRAPILSYNHPPPPCRPLISSFWKVWLHPGFCIPLCSIVPFWTQIKLLSCTMNTLLKFHQKMYSVVAVTTE